MYSILHRRCPQYLLDLITFNDSDADSGQPMNTCLLSWWLF